MGTTIYRLPLQIISLVFCCSLSAQTVISDSIGFFWDEIVDTAFGATAIHYSTFSGGNPGSYRHFEHNLPLPPSLEDLTYVSVTHIYDFDDYSPALDGAITFINYAEDLRLINLPWNQAFIRSFPALRQNDRIYRANQYIEVIADTSWTSGVISGLTAEDFLALDGSLDNPDFSNQGSQIEFGFWRGSSRGFTIPPVSPDTILIIKHGIDNFTVTISTLIEPPLNQPPVAIVDNYLYLDYFSNAPSSLPVLENDNDPDGDTIRILDVQEPFHGTIESFNETTINYSFDSPLSSGQDEDFFLYTITDGELSSYEAFVTMYFCICPLQCIGLFLAEPDTSISPNPIIEEPIGVTRSKVDTLDIELYRRFRDDVLQPTEAGATLVDLYYHHAKEVMPLLLFTRRDLGRKASNALILMQDPIRSLLDGDGSELITQELVDSVNMFLDSLMLIVSDSLHDALQSAFTLLCPFEDLVGLTVAEAAQSAICDSMNTSMEDLSVPELKNGILKQNYPNPFSPSTQSLSSTNAETEIPYTLPKSANVQLMIYNIHGRKIKTLFDEFQINGERSIGWNGTDDHGNLVSAGIYFYQIRVNGFRETKGMILVR